MAERKTVETDASVTDFLSAVENETQREDARVVARLMRKVSGKRPRMWGPSIVGFGRHAYTLANGKTADICQIGFAPRARSLAFYLGSFDGKTDLLNKLGKHKVQGSCLHIRTLADVDLDVLETLFEKAYRHRSQT